MKKISLLLTVLLLLSFAVFALGSGESGSGTEDQGTGNVQPGENQGNLGSYRVTIDSCRMAEDYEGKPVVIVNYIFENVSSDTAAAFYIVMTDNVYQNGVGLNKAYVLADGANYNEDNSTKEIKKGASITVEVAYVLNDTTTDLEVEVTESFGFDNKVVSKTFKISG